MNEQGKQKLTDKLNGDTIRKIIVIAGLLGIALIFISGYIGSDDKENEVHTEEYSDFDCDKYRSELESRLADIISHIDGAGNTGVMITLESGREYIYAQNTSVDEDSDSDSNKTSNSKEYFTVDNKETGDEPVLIKINEPKVCGVIVVCSGADNPSVKAKVVDAVTSIFNITETKVSVNKINN